jgi:hypothetical protein
MINEKGEVMKQSRFLVSEKFGEESSRGWARHFA